MNQTRHIHPGAPLPKTYTELVALLVPRPISDNAVYENTVTMVDALAGHALNRDQEDYLDILSDLIETYEQERLPKLRKLPPPQLLQTLLDENNLGGEDLAALLKIDRSVAYKILKGTRNLTLEHVRRLSERFALNADLFI